MAEFLQLNKFAQGGLNSDIMPWDLPGEFLTEIKNFRVKNNKLIPAGGSTLLATLPVGIVPGHIQFVNASIPYYIIACDDSVYVYDFTSFTDISNTDGYAGGLADSWQGTSISGIPIINNISHYPEYWAPQSISQTMQYLPWDATNSWKDVNKSAAIIRAHKQFLFAMDLQEGADEIPDGVRWSSPADINSLPETWDELDTTNFAGLTHLGFEGGKIVDGMSLRDSFVVYREKGIAAFDYVGGNFVFQVRQLDTATGLISRKAIVEVNGNHFFIGDGDIYINDGHQIKSLTHKRIREKFRSDYNADKYYLSFAVRNDSNSEVWFCIPSQSSDYPNVAYVYNWHDDTWSIVEIPECASVAYGKVQTQSLTWADMNFSWDTVNRPWDRRKLTPLDDAMVAVTKPVDALSSGSLYIIDNPNANNSSFNCVLERVGYALAGLNNTTTINRIFPHIKGPGIVNIQIGSQDYPGSPVRWKPSVAFNPVTDRSITIRTTGELHCFRFTNADNLSFEFSGIDIEYVGAGKR